MKRLVAGLVVGMLSMSVVGAQAPVQAPEPKPDPKEVAEGRKLFASQLCTVCHMAEGNGNKTNSMDGPTAHVAKLTTAEIRKWITDPAEMTAKLAVKPMIPMQKVELTPAQVSALVAYIRSLK